MCGSCQGTIVAGALGSSFIHVHPKELMPDDKQSGLSWSTPHTPKPQLAPKPAASSTAPILHTQTPVYAGLLVGGIIVGVLLATGWSSYKEGKPRAMGQMATSTPTAGTTNAPQVASKTAPPLVVEDQPAGSSVKIGSLNIARPTWVVVYVSREGRPGNALGARLFFAGDKEGSVGLLRDTQAGARYYIGLSVDNGDRAFSLSKDLPLADADGGPLWATFRAQ